MAIKHKATHPRPALWGVDHVGNLDDLDDVTITTVATGNVPVWNGTAWVNADHGSIGGLTDDDHPQYVKDSEFGAAGDVLQGTGAGTFAARKNNLAAIVAPTANEDSGDGYSVGSRWIDVTADEEYVCLDATPTAAVWANTTDTAASAPTDADYLVGTAHAGLSAEIVVGTTPGGELGGTWASPTVDATHSGSAHHAQAHALVHADHPESGLTAGHVLRATAATTYAFGAIQDADIPSSIARDTEVTTAVSDHAAAADPHTGYRLESADHSHQSTGLQGGQLDHGAALTGLSDDDHPQYVKDSEFTAAGDLLRGTGAGTFAAVKNNNAAAVAPVAGDDSADGYTVGSRWLDTTADKEYICLDNSLGAAVWKETTAGAGTGAPTAADYLVGTAHGDLSAEIVVGTTPGGELGGTWASPTVDATHSGSAHHAQSHDHSAAGDGQSLKPVNLYVPARSGIYADPDTNEIVFVGGAELNVADTPTTTLKFFPSSTALPTTQAFGDAADAGVATYTNARIGHKHAMPANPVTAHEGAADPHTGYRLESADHTHQSTGAEGGKLDHGLALNGLTDDDHTQYLLASGARDLAGDLVPDADGTRDLGNTTDRFAEAHVDAVFTDALDDAGAGAGLEAKVGIWPGTDSALDLGKTGKTWQHVWAEGIQFPATQVASANVNNLDDYEEGTWTPTYWNLDVVQSATMDHQQGVYVKVGKWVTVLFSMTGTRGTLSHSNLYVAGLPYVSAANPMSWQAGWCAYSTLVGLVEPPGVAAAANADYLNLYFRGAQVPYSALDGTNRHIIGGCTYAV